MVLADLPLQQTGRHLTAAGAVNGHPAVFVLDTGAEASAMPRIEAERLGVKLDRSSVFTTEGPGGRVYTVLGHYDLTFAGLVLPHTPVTVLNTDADEDHVTSRIGRELIDQRDLEIDLPQSRMRIEDLDGCSVANLSSYLRPATVVRLESDGTRRSPILFNVVLNGHTVPAELDSGLAQSLVTPSAARAARGDLAKAAAHEDVQGLGPARLAAKIVKFDTFVLGGETIRNAKLVVADLWKDTKVEEIGTRLGSESHNAGQPEMLLGADFLRSHRVLVANSMGVMLVSYTGGRVFDVAAPATDAAPRPVDGRGAAEREGAGGETVLAAGSDH